MGKIPNIDMRVTGGKQAGKSCEASVDYHNVSSSYVLQ